MRAAIIYDAGSAEWSPQDVAAVLSNVHEVRTSLRRRDHDVELVPVRLGEFRWPRAASCCRPAAFDQHAWRR